MSKTDLIAENVRLYSIWTGELKVYIGNVYANNTSKDYAGFYGDNKRFLCSSKEGLVYSSVIWFRKDVQNLATELLIKHKQKQIWEYEQKIEKLNKIVKVLKGE